MNKRAALAIGIGTSLVLAASAANAAGTCATEVQALQQQLGMEQGANARTGPTDPGVQQPTPSASVDTGAATTMDDDQIAADNDANATIGATDPGVQQPAPEANAQSTTGTGTSTDSTTSTDGSSVTTADNTGANATIGPSDPGVQQPSDTDPVADSSDTMSSDSSGTPSPTITETSRVGEMDTAAGGRAAALASLKKAQLYADAGQEDACMSEVSTAKQHMGVQ
jgi:hypothetical protein